MKVKLHKTGNASFALIDDKHGALSIQLDKGLPAGASLRKYANECREKSRQYELLAKRADLASEII